MDLDFYNRRKGTDWFNRRPLGACLHFLDARSAFFVSFGVFFSPLPAWTSMVVGESRWGSPDLSHDPGSAGRLGEPWTRTALLLLRGQTQHSPAPHAPPAAVSQSPTSQTGASVRQIGPQSGLFYRINTRERGLVLFVKALIRKCPVCFTKTELLHRPSLRSAWIGAMIYFFISSLKILFQIVSKRARSHFSYIRFSLPFIKRNWETQAILLLKTSLRVSHVWRRRTWGASCVWDYHTCAG